jgi:hypothetical protein
LSQLYKKKKIYNVGFQIKKSILWLVLPGKEEKFLGGHLGPDPLLQPRHEHFPIAHKIKEHFDTPNTIEHK